MHCEKRSTNYVPSILLSHPCHLHKYIVVYLNASWTILDPTLIENYNEETNLKLCHI